MTSTDLSEALRSFFADIWPTDAPIPEPRPLEQSGWLALVDLGLHQIGVAEHAGGSGGSLGDLLEVAQLAGRYAADIPIVEHALGAWALTEAGADLPPESTLTLAHAADALMAHPDGTVSGSLVRVPWGSMCDHVVSTLPDGRTIALSVSEAAVEPGLDLAGTPCDTLRFDGASPWHCALGATAEDLASRAAALRVALIAGALQSVSELTQRYVNERVQFGKPIGSFQAVQAHIVLVEQMAVLTDSLAHRLALGSTLDTFEVQAAELVARENAVAAVRASHQAHGAIGMTREYRLQGFTRRLHVWSAGTTSAVEAAASLGIRSVAAPSVSRLVLDPS
ncbi:acyl-CoA dehydrogenase family protein [Aeromicrobium sp. HA]|uniref:acyl-CoA dehydrogenase family protein n=1 Tax=Aeromicrobium sp. HA TaxID=3009077 RepID=UPI0022AF6936|nr:acyl-CoA dehydrogenase family protein [Aeromicrobium sp. HA]